MKWCLTVKSQKTWDYNAEYKLCIKEYLLLKVVSERTFNLTLEADAPCIIKNPPVKVVEFEQSKSGKSSDNNKVNTTAATGKVDQAPVRDTGKDSLATNILNSTLYAGEINGTSDVRDLTQPSITNVTYIREETTIPAITNVTPIREETTILAITNVTPIRE